MLPMTLEQVQKEEINRKGKNVRESDKQSRVSHNHSERVSPQLNAPQPNKSKPKWEKNGLVLMARKGDIKELRDAQSEFFVLMYKESLLSTNDLPSTLPSVVFDLLQEYEDMFPDEVYHLGCHQSEE